MEKSFEADVFSVTYVVVCFNQGRFLEECLTGIYAQGFSDSNIIVIDNCSTDDSVSYIENCEKKFLFQKLIRNDSSLTKALNEALQVITTDFFIPIAADDYPVHNRELIVRRYLSKYPSADALFGNMYLVNDEGKATKPYLREPIIEKKWTIEEYLLDRSRLYSPAGIFRVKTLKELGGYSEEFLLEDYQMIIKLLDSKKEIYSIEHALVFYRVYGQNFHKNYYRLFLEKVGILSQYSSRSWFKRAMLFVYLEHFSNFGSSNKIHALKLLPYIFWRFDSKYFWIGWGRLILDWRFYV